MSFPNAESEAVSLTASRFPKKHLSFAVTFLINRFAADEGLQYTDRQYLRRCDFCDVTRDNSQVCQFAGLNRSLRLLFKLSVGGFDRVAFQSLFKRQLLLWIPAAWWVSLRILSCDRSIDSVERI